MDDGKRPTDMDDPRWITDAVWAETRRRRWFRIKLAAVALGTYGFLYWVTDPWLAELIHEIGCIIVPCAEQGSARP